MLSLLVIVSATYAACGIFVTALMVVSHIQRGRKAADSKRPCLCREGRNDLGGTAIGLAVVAFFKRYQSAGVNVELVRHGQAKAIYFVVYGDRGGMAFLPAAAKLTSRSESARPDSYRSGPCPGLWRPAIRKLRNRIAHHEPISAATWRTTRIESFDW